jgi:hypothetical protein
MHTMKPANSEHPLTFGSSTLGCSESSAKGLHVDTAFAKAHQRETAWDTHRELGRQPVAQGVWAVTTSMSSRATYRL